MEKLSEQIVNAQAGDKKLRDTLIEENLGLVHHIVKRFGASDFDKEELFQVGCIGLVKAIDQFDPSFEVKLSTYAVPLILGEIKRFIRDNTLLKIPRSAKENRNRLLKAEKELEMQTGKEPDMETLCQMTGLSREDALFALETGGRVESLSRPVFEAENDMQLGDMIADKNILEEEVLNKQLIQNVLSYLKEEDRRLVSLRYLYNKTQAETARMLGLSQVKVSRYEKRILLMLRNYLSS